MSGGGRVVMSGGGRVVMSGGGRVVCVQTRAPQRPGCAGPGTIEY
jgi:hypothetical protein